MHGPSTTSAESAWCARGFAIGLPTPEVEALGAYRTDCRPQRQRKRNEADGDRSQRAQLGVGEPEESVEGPKRNRCVHRCLQRAGALQLHLRCLRLGGCHGVATGAADGVSGAGTLQPFEPPRVAVIVRSARDSISTVEPDTVGLTPTHVPSIANDWSRGESVRSYSS